MKKIIILLSLILFLGSCVVSNQPKQVPTNTKTHPVYVNSEAEVNPYIKRKDKNSYEKTYKKHIKQLKRDFYK